MSTGEHDRARPDEDGPPPAGPIPAGPPPTGRRRALVVGAAVLAVLLLGGLGAWWATRGDDGPTTATGPAPTTSGPTTSTPTTSEPTTSEPTTSSATTTAPPTTTTTAPPPTSTASTGPATAVPAGMVLPGEGQEGYEPQEWWFQPCDEPMPDGGATDVRSVASAQPEDFRTQSLLVFATPDAATAFHASVRAEAESCAGPGDPVSGAPALSVHPLEGAWDEGLAVVLAYPGEGGYGPGGDYSLVVRRGTAVVFSTGYGEWAPGYPDPDPSAVAEYREPLDLFAPELCVFTAEGC